MNPTESSKAQELAEATSAAGGPLLDPLAETIREGVAACTRRRIFLLSPANVSGIRGKLILNPGARFELALRFQQHGLPLGELFSFISGLYFRGKLAYAQAFAGAPAGVPGTFVITTCRGLVPADTLVTCAEMQEMTTVPVKPSDSRYLAPLERDARMISELAGEGCEVVLLGSIATPKYVEPLIAILGERLVFPAEFVGRGDMSRGGLMLRCARAGVQLTYVPVATAVRHGCRPPKLAPPEDSTPACKTRPVPLRKRRARESRKSAY